MEYGNRCEGDRRLRRMQGAGAGAAAGEGKRASTRSPTRLPQPDTARPAVLRPAGKKGPCGAFFSAREIPFSYGSPKASASKEADAFFVETGQTSGALAAASRRTHQTEGRGLYSPRPSGGKRFTFSFRRPVRRPFSGTVSSVRPRRRSHWFSPRFFLRNRKHPSLHDHFLYVLGVVFLA